MFRVKVKIQIVVAIIFYWRIVMFIVSVWSSAAFVLWQSGVLRCLTLSLKQNKFAIQPIAENAPYLAV